VTKRRRGVYSLCTAADHRLFWQRRRGVEDKQGEGGCCLNARKQGTVVERRSSRDREVKKMYDKQRMWVAGSSAWLMAGVGCSASCKAEGKEAEGKESKCHQRDDDGGGGNKTRTQRKTQEEVVVLTGRKRSSKYQEANSPRSTAWL
jgi:hypothetical protein